MSNLLIAYPNISNQDLERIQNIRKSHDPKYYDVVNPHITLVFGTQKLSLNHLLDHAKTVLSAFSTVSLCFDKALVVEDDSKTFFHTFLVPSKGYDDIIKIHDALYTGELLDELREDIPFIPHIGIGINEDEKTMDSLATSINDNQFLITGVLDEITLVQYDGTKVRDITSISLL